MKTSSIIFVFLCVIFSAQSHQNLLVDKLRWEFLQLEDELWDFVLKDSKYAVNIDPQVILAERFSDFDEKLRQIPQDILRGLEPVKHIHAFLFLYSDLKAINHLYKKFRRYQEAQLKSLRINVKDAKDPPHADISRSDIVNDILSEENGANVTITNIYNLTFGKENMIWEVFQEQVADDYMCKNYHQSSQQIFYNLYNTIALNGLKSYMMLQFAYMSSRLIEKGNFTQMSKSTRDQFETRVNNTMITFRGAMEVVPKYIWRCDPKRHVRGETYEEITKFLQGYIQNEVDLNPDKTCTQTCNAYPKTRSYGCYDWKSQYCKKMKRCNGDIYNCKFIESHMEVCISPESSFRMIDYVKFNSGKTMGEETICWDRKVESWHRWFVHCSTCVCICDEQGDKSDRFFSLRPVFSNLKNNSVITGLRFIKRNRIIHLQIQEGRLLPYGYIDNSTVRWVPVDDFKTNDHGVKRGEDYFILDYTHRTLNLDDIPLTEEGRIVTGVMFNTKNNILRFGIQARAFEFETGIVSHNDSYSVYGDGPRTRIPLESSDVPTESPPSIPDHDGDKYIQFTHTDFDKDVAQTTVPFLDIQPVYADPPVPLTGAGLFYKGRKWYGGFIAPKIRTYDFSKHMNIGLPAMKPREESFGAVEVDIA